MYFSGAIHSRVSVHHWSAFCQVILCVKRETIVTPCLQTLFQQHRHLHRINFLYPGFLGLSTVLKLILVMRNEAALATLQGQPLPSAMWLFPRLHFRLNLIIMIRQADICVARL
ncbi:hypothetical protein A9K55_004554 [Cordyceps militaris]|uniref:Uncharacterized protein n=1 Tax=Cordyceps militaris TaxID=73501 RepID=A0A2H4SPJ2_CORMI|nr:hypothetical protein A9K55_004554 [Cordyceps militaris]